MTEQIAIERANRSAELSKKRVYVLRDVWGFCMVTAKEIMNYETIYVTI